MTSAVHEYAYIARKLNRQDQKADFEAKNPQPSAYERACGVTVPLVDATEHKTPTSCFHASRI